MTRALKNSDEDLQQLGVNLQSLLMQSRARLTKVSARKRLRLQRSITNAEYVFNTISATVQTSQRIESFLQDKFGFGLQSVLKAAGHDPQKAKRKQKNILTALNKSIEFVISDLTKANAEVDMEKSNVK